MQTRLCLLWHRDYVALATASGFIQSNIDGGAFLRYNNTGALEAIIILWVDDNILFCPQGQHASIFKRFQQSYALKITTDPDMVLGINIHQSADGITLSSSTYITKMLELYDMASCKPMRTPFAPGTIIDASQPIPDNP